MRLNHYFVIAAFLMICTFTIWATLGYITQQVAADKTVIEKNTINRKNNMYKELTPEESGELFHLNRRVQ